MENPVPVGIIKTTNGLKVPVCLDYSYIIDPDTAHVNASGRSGNKKLAIFYSFYYLLIKLLKKPKIFP